MVKREESQETPRNPFSTSISTVLWTVETLSPVTTIKIHGYVHFTFTYQVSFSVFVPLLDTVRSWDNMSIFLFGHVCEFFLFNTIGMYIKG